MIPRLVLILAILAIALVDSKSFNKKEDAVLLSNVRSLTLSGEKSTSHRRVEAIPQLQCVGGNGCSYYKVDVMRCENSGSEYDAEDIQWTCRASLPPEFKLGSTDVICEGYDGPDDPYILKGSCGVEYRLALTDAGEEKYRRHENSQQQPLGSKKNTRRPADEIRKDNSPVEAFWTLFFWVVFLSVAGIIIYRAFQPSEHAAAPNRHRNRLGDGGGGGGRGDDGGNDDPPPPYTPQDQPRAKPGSKKSAPMAWTSTQSIPQESRTNEAGSSNANNQQWRPGFWTGAATGAAAGGAAGYYAGSRSRTQDPEVRERNERTRRWELDERERRERMEREDRERRERLESDRREREHRDRLDREERERRERQSLFNWPTFNDRPVTCEPSSFGGSGPSSPPAPSSSRHESTGFGGTKRR